MTGPSPWRNCFSPTGLGSALTFPFAVGATTILWPGPPTAPNVFAQIERFKPTLFFSVPTNYGMLLAHHREGGPDFDLSSLRLAVSAGEALPAALYERFRERFGMEILDGIGSTEILHIFISNRPGGVRPGSSGQIVPGYEAKLLDEKGAEVPRGEIGNLLVKGDSTCAFYWNQHERTKDTIEGHWIRTGDKYRQDEDGYYWYAGRSDDMLKVGGIWVSPVEIENTLIEHACVQEAGVIGRRDQDGLEKPMAFIVLAQGVQPSEELARQLEDFVRSKIAEYKAPALDRVRAGAAQDRHGKDPALQAPGPGSRGATQLAPDHVGEEPSGPGILAGLRVVELSAFVAAPLAGMTLAALGADVIRIDRPRGRPGFPPLAGDPGRPEPLLDGLEQGKALGGDRFVDAPRPGSRRPG